MKRMPGKDRVFRETRRVPHSPFNRQFGKRRSRRFSTRHSSLVTRHSSLSILAHEEDEGADVLFRSPFPVTQKYGVDQEYRFAFPPQYIFQRLGHEILTGQSKKNADGVDELAAISDRIGNGNGSGNLNDKIAVFFAHVNLDRGKELAPVVEQFHMDECDG